MGLAILIFWLIGIPFFVAPFARWIYEPNERWPDPPHTAGQTSAIALAIFAAFFWPLLILIIGFVFLCRYISAYAFGDAETPLPDLRSIFDSLGPRRRTRSTRNEFAQGRVWESIAEGDEHRLVIVGMRTDGALILERFQGPESGAIITVYRDQLEAAYKPTAETIEIKL